MNLKNHENSSILKRNQERDHHFQLTRRNYFLLKHFNSEGIKNYESLISLPFKWKLTSSKEAYLAMGLAGETGEVIEIIKKLSSNLHKNVPNWKHNLKLEIGDTLWYLISIAHYYGFDMKDIMLQNCAKCFRKNVRRIFQIYSI